MSAIAKLVDATTKALEGHKTFNAVRCAENVRRMENALAALDREELREELRAVAEAARPDVHPLDCAVIARAVVEHLLGGDDGA